MASTRKQLGPSDLAPLDDAARRADIEQWLEDWDVEWYYDPEVPLEKVNLAKSRQNQARDEALVPDLVESYTELMEHGTEFPAVVSYPDPVGGLILIDGNNRIAAALSNDFESFPHYVVEPGTDPIKLQAMTLTANGHNGLIPEERVRVSHAIWLVRNAGVSPDEAARQLALPKGKVQGAVNKEAAIRRAQKLKVRGFVSLANSSQARLNQIKMDRWFERAAQLAVDTRMKSPEVFTMVTDINKMSSEEDTWAYLDQLEANLATRRQGRVMDLTGSPRNVVRMYVGGIRKLDEAAVVESVPSAERPQMIRDLEDAASRLSLLAEKLRGK